MSVLNTDLLRAVETELVPRVRHLGFAITEHQEGQSFDNATVTLASGDIRVRVFRERGVGGVLDEIGSFLNSSSADLQRGIIAICASRLRVEDVLVKTD